MRISRFALGAGLLAAPLLSACETPTSDTAVEEAYFCESWSDADTFRIEDGGLDSTSSGKLIGRLITDEADDLHSPTYVSFMEFTLENLDRGGSHQTGETNQDGGFEKTIGEGNWRIKLSGTKGGLSCNNQQDIVIEAGNTTRLCMDVACQ